MKNVIKLHRSTADDVNEILEDAFQAEFEEVVVVGIRGQDVMIWHSATISRARVIGLLEMAKYDLLTAAEPK